MQLRGDDRGAAIQVGAIVLFAFVIIAITAYQASVVPSQNEEIEYNHNQRVQGQLQDLEAAVGSTSGTGDARKVTVDLSTSYPARTIFVNPPAPTGRLQTVGTRNATVAFEVRNATATNPDVDDFWNGSTRNYSTGAVVYQPNYNAYNQAPRTVVENSLVYNEFADATLTTNQQSLFDGNAISLTALRGSLREDGGTASVNVRPVSADTTTVPVQADGTDNVTVSIVSRLSPSRWNDTVAAAGELHNQSGGHVYKVSGGQIGTLNGAPVYQVNFTMERGETYDLQLARVGVGSLSGSEDTTNASYTVAVTDSVTTDEGTNATVTVEVRDRYDNPKGGVEVNATAVGGAGGSIADSPQTTNEDGRATFTYNTTTDVSGSTKETDTVRVSFTGDPATGFDESAPANVTSEVTVKNTDGSGTGGGGGGGGGAYSVEFKEGSSYTWDVATEGSSINLTAITDPPGIEGVSTDFAVNDSSVAEVNSEETETNPSGEADVKLDANANGEVAVYIGSGGSSDVINVTVTGLGGGTPSASYTYSPSSPLPGESVEFDASGSTDDGTVKYYEWDWNDGTTDNVTSPTISHTFSSPGSYDVTLKVTDDDGNSDTVTKTVTVDPLPKFSAVEPDPDALDASDEGEFVRVYFPTSTDTTGWTIVDDEGDTTNLPETSISGEIYFAKNETAFEDEWGLADDKVYSLNTPLANGGDVVELRTNNGRIIDEFGYNGEDTSNGWNLNGVDKGDVAVRDTDASGYYNDTNSSSDWSTEDESSFFNGASPPPGLESVSVQNAPLNQSDVGTSHTVTLRFNKTMDTSVAPTVGLSDLGSSGTYNSSLSNNGAWVNNTTWQSSFTLTDDDEDVLSTMSVADAQDDTGQTMTKNTSNTVVVDTKQPNDPDSVRIITDPINSSNQGSVIVEVDVSNPDSDGGMVYVQLADNDGNTVVASTTLQTGSGTVTTTVSGVNVSALNDADPNAAGGITAGARVVDDLGNENPSGYTTQSNEVLKDTKSPSIAQFDLSNPSGDRLDIVLKANESLSTIEVDIEDSSETVVRTLTRTDFSQNAVSADEYYYNATISGVSDDEYTAVLNVAEDDAGNDGSSGETDTAVVDTTPPTVESASAEARDVDGNKNDAEEVKFTFVTVDNIAVDNVTVRVFDKNQNPLGTSTTTVQNDTLRVSGFSENLKGGSLEVEIQVNDTSGNSRSCTGTIDNVGQNITKSGGKLDCTVTSTASVIASNLVRHPHSGPVYADIQRDSNSPSTRPNSGRSQCGV